MGRQSIVLCIVLGAAGGCYAELGASYYPSIHETVTMEGGDRESMSSAGFGVSFKLGFYLDIAIPPLRSAIGLGWSPKLNGEAIRSSDLDAQVTGNGNELRGDVALPMYIGGSHAQFWISASRLSVDSANVLLTPATEYVHTKLSSGSVWFVGPSVGGPFRSGGGGLFSIGVHRHAIDTELGSPGQMSKVEVTATGLGARLMLHWTPTLLFFKHWTPSKTREKTFYTCWTKTSCD